MNKIALLLTSSLALTAVTGCASLSGNNSPDEFRVVKKAPLVVPPEYSLRPPQAGQSQPFEVDEERAGTASAFGTDIGQNASAAERALVAAAGANAVDWEESKTIRKSTSISDRVLFWQRGEDETPDSATGGEEVTIERGSGERLKLPGT